MPEYLAPAVYVEEVDTGSKPIEGVSTSTAGMIGVAERGPVNVPILITSYGEYRRWFGDTLDPALYGEHRYLPHAVEGFFSNGGKRVYVTRILDVGNAAASTRTLVAPDNAPRNGQLARNAPGGQAEIVVIDNPGFADGNMIQIDDGVSAEFRSIQGAPAQTNLIGVDLPPALNHPGGAATAVERINAPVNAAANAYSSTLISSTTAGDRRIQVANASPAVAIQSGDLLRIDSGASSEYIYVDGAPVGNSIPLRAPLQVAHVPTAVAPISVVRQAPAVVLPGQTTNLSATGSFPGDLLLDLVNNASFTIAGDFLQLRDTANPARTEIRRIGGFQRVALTPVPTAGVNGGAAYAQYPSGSRIEQVAAPAVSALSIDLLEPASRGSIVVRVSNRTLFQLGDLLQIGVGADRELVEVVALPASLPNPNPGTVILRAPLRRDHAAAVGVIRHAAAPNGVILSGVLISPAAVDAADVIIAMQGMLVNGEYVRIYTPSGGPFYHLVQGVQPINPRRMALDNPLLLAHMAGSGVTLRQPMIEVRALDAGQWGNNRLRVAMEAQSAPLLTTQVLEKLSDTELRLASAAGVEVGTELWVTDAALNQTGHKVVAIDRQNRFLITLDATTPLPGNVTGGHAVRSREYRFVVELLRQPDAANPSRNNQVLDREVFVGLSLDPLHSRYFQRVIGCTWDITDPTVTTDDTGHPLRRADRRSEGESAYVRVRDLTPSSGLRSGPVPSYETRADGTQRLTLLPLGNGSDQLALVNDGTYIGRDDPDPELREGLFTLRNIEEISILAAPGRTSVQMQNALINHCELMRYRFAALDGLSPPHDSMADVQAQRQQFDTKYAALYHPWLLIPDPYPATNGTIPDYPVPPSGHVLGIYARTDIERGVHKAPANEVVRGIIGLQRILNKEQHDILNPYPVNINVIRDFRPNNRGIRVYGGRVITSDSDWKYVNVRRLLIFIEASIDRGLQWVVFEPNAEPLWARVRRSISNFLRLVWRNGALEGTKPEEAFFVKCDRTTMTQTDIDQGRLICLVGVAPVKPAEFVIVRIGLWTAHADD